MDAETLSLCQMIGNRSRENREAMRCFPTPHRVLSPAVSILRQELDSMVRVIYLLTVKDLAERQRLIRSTLRGEKWKARTAKGSLRNVTDREMIDLAQGLQGWTQSVYRFGCAFIHLSDFHNHFVQNPFSRLPRAEREHVLAHLRYYHTGPMDDNPDLRELSAYIPRVFEKIADNLECYLDQLKRGKSEES